jgi:hypothetical protein
MGQWFRVPFVPCFQGLWNFRITISSEMVRSALPLEDEEDRLHERRFVQIGSVIGQRMDGKGDLFLGHSEPQAGKSGD